MSLSLNQSAKHFKRGKSSILAALANGSLTGKKNDLGQWEIEPAEMDRWVRSTRRTVLIPHNKTTTEPIHTMENTAENLLKIGRLEWELEQKRKDIERMMQEAVQLRQDIADARKDRDAWREEYKAIKLLPAPEKAIEALSEVQKVAEIIETDQEPEKKLSFWSRFFRKSA